MKYSLYQVHNPKGHNKSRIKKMEYNIRERKSVSFPAEINQSFKTNRQDFKCGLYIFNKIKQKVSTEK
jgi:hypothetical protein